MLTTVAAVLAAIVFCFVSCSMVGVCALAADLSVIWTVMGTQLADCVSIFWHNRSNFSDVSCHEVIVIQQLARDVVRPCIISAVVIDKLASALADSACLFHC